MLTDAPYYNNNKYNNVIILDDHCIAIIFIIITTYWGHSRPYTTDMISDLECVCVWPLPLDVTSVLWQRTLTLRSLCVWPLPQEVTPVLWQRTLTQWSSHSHLAGHCRWAPVPVDVGQGGDIWNNGHIVDSSTVTGLADLKCFQKSWNKTESSPLFSCADK